MAQTPPGGSGGGRLSIPYANPLRKVGNLVAERVDQGVDYSGQGPVFALGPGVITAVGTGTGWGPPQGIAPGGFISERISEGPLAGRQVYVAEAVYPSVRVGQRVTSGTVIGRMVGGIETGFAAPGTSGVSGESLATYLGETGSAQVATLSGAAYSRVLKDLGAPPGTMSGSPAGPGPSWLDTLLHAGLGFFGQPGGPGGGVGGVLGSGIAGAIEGLTSWLSGLDTAITWLLNPSNWVRIVCGVGGGILVIAGVYSMTHTGAVQVMGSEVQRPAALPVGIFMTGAGGVLLFIAFHQLPADVQGIGGLLGYEQGKLAAAASGQPAGAGP